MEIITSHNNTDLDALASVVAASFLFPDAVCVLPSMVNPNVRSFLSLHKDLFRLHTMSEIDLCGVKRLIVVDANDWGRLDRMAELRERNDIEILRWDHHICGGSIKAHKECQEDTGAAVTLLARELKRQDCAFTPMHATLFLMGLYEDTGNLSFPSTMPEDVYAAGFFLENGADLNVASAYLSTSFDEDHKELLASLLEGSQVLSLDGFRVGICMRSVKGSFSMLSPVVEKYKELSGLDAAFGIFALEPGRFIVIGRSGFHGLDVCSVVRRLGGGGHPGAGSAMVKNTDADELLRKVLELVKTMERPNVDVGSIMSNPELCLSPHVPMRQAQAMIERTRARAALITDADKLLGALTAADCSKAKRESQRAAPVKAFMKTHLPVLSRGSLARDALRVMGESDVGFIPVVEDGLVVGVVTRADLMLQIYEL
jgi:tRNA nucleotidyltransferase (CCA-adding enzyme)